MAMVTKADIVKDNLHVLTAKRVLIHGGPDTFKTTSIVETWGRPLHIVSLPGEKGWATIPFNVDGIEPYVWRTDTTAGESSFSVMEDVERTIFEIIAGKKGPVKTLAIEGLHKYYKYALDKVTGGAVFRGEQFEAYIYSRAHDIFHHTFNRILSSDVDYIVCTSWDGREPDAPKSQSSHIFPQLPGQAAKLIIGEFPTTVYSTSNFKSRLFKDGKLAPAVGKWQIQPKGEVWGAHIKAPKEVVLRLPDECEQSLPVLEEIIRKAWEGK